jgi:hypothetical protein
MLCNHVPGLHHLSLRYCKRLTDEAINAISRHLELLLSIDLSFCSKITSRALLDLLDVRSSSLSEFRIRGCNRLDITQDFMIMFPTEGIDSTHTSKGLHQGCGMLSIMDVRGCGGYTEAVGYERENRFVIGMERFGFDQQPPGFFSRKSRWNSSILVRHLRRQRIASLHLT